MSQQAITAEGLSKKYILGSINSGTVTNYLKKWWGRMLVNNDPTFLIGQQNLRHECYALNDISFQIKKGEVVGIIKIISKNTLPTKGHSRVEKCIASLLEVVTGFNSELSRLENIFLKIRATILFIQRVLEHIVDMDIKRICEIKLVEEQQKRLLWYQS